MHSRYDIRIFVKMCSSLASNGYDVFLIVADGVGEELKNNIHIIDIGAKPKNRLSRMITTVKIVSQKAIELNADVYHLHDPELIPLGLSLNKMKKKVIFDAHEDLVKQIYSKPYLNTPLKVVLSKLISIYEKAVCGKMDAIIAATPSIRDKFLRINSNSVNINNYPLLSELENSVSWSDKENDVVYVGGIGQIRGIKQVVRALGHTTGVRLKLIGKFSEDEVEKEVKSYKSWLRVDELGFLDRQSVSTVLAGSKVGIVTFLPAPNHIDAQPNKMFEYMSAGIPIVASNFPMWKELVEGVDCGICVDPLDPKAIAKAIMYLIKNPKEAEMKGRNGRKVVEEKYNWGKEKGKLLNLYKKLEI